MKRAAFSWQRNTDRRRTGHPNREPGDSGVWTYAYSFVRTRTLSQSLWQQCERIEECGLGTLQEHVPTPGCGELIHLSIPK